MFTAVLLANSNCGLLKEGIKISEHRCMIASILLLVSRELRAQGYNMTLDGRTNLVRELRNGRNFEYPRRRSDPSGHDGESTHEGAASATYDRRSQTLPNERSRESGRNGVDVRINERSMRETDLLPFQIGLRHLHVDRDRLEHSMTDHK